MKRFAFFFLLILIGCDRNETEIESVNNFDGDNLNFEMPQQVISKMTRGINIGNTLEPPQVGEWNNEFISEYFFDDYVDAGFNTVRIPIRWDKHTLVDSPFTVSESWLDTVEQVIDWGLSKDLFLIINAHHDWWLVNNYDSIKMRDRFHSIWNQISSTFKDKSPKLLFEIINEPHGMSKENVDELNFDILQIIRTDNPKRIVIYGGHSWSNSDHLLSAKVLNDPYIIGYFHSYDPWEFAGKGNGLWGSENDINTIKTKFKTVADWSEKNNIPVIISEFGAIHDCDYNSRMLHYFTYVKEAINNGFAFQAWDDGGQFKIYNRNARTWPEVKDILIHTYPDSPEDFRAQYVSDNQAFLTWKLTSSDCSKIVIEKSSNSVSFETLKELDYGTTEYIDNSSNVVNSVYRIVSICSNNVRKHSNPHKVTR